MRLLRSSFFVGRRGTISAAPTSSSFPITTRRRWPRRGGSPATCSRAASLRVFLPEGLGPHGGITDCGTDGPGEHRLSGILLLPTRVEKMSEILGNEPSLDSLSTAAIRPLFEIARGASSLFPQEA